jgi:hypothetical protein
MSLAIRIAALCLSLLIDQATPGTRVPQTAQTRAEDLAAFRERFMARDQSYSNAGRAEAERRLDRLGAELSTISQPAFELELARIVALADNGHSHYVLGSIQRYYNRIPLRIGVFGTDFAVLRARTNMRDLLGTTLVSIDGHDIEELRAAGRALWGGVPAFRDEFAFNLFESPDLLNACGLAVRADAATYRFRTPAGTVIERHIVGEGPYATRPFAQPDRTLFPEPLPLEDSGWSTALPVARAPWSLQNFSERFRSRPAPEVNGLVIELQQNMSTPDAKIAPALAEFERAIAEAKPTNLVVDMRVNGGGDLNTTRDFMVSLPTRVPGRIFVLTSPLTFSAAISSVGYLKQAAPDRVTIVGEPVGDRLVFFAEGRGVDLPNSLGMVGMGTQRHDYQGGCRVYTDCHKSVVTHPIAVPSLAPDISAPWTVAAYLAGVDPAIEAIRHALSARGAAPTTGPHPDFWLAGVAFDESRSRLVVVGAVAGQFETWERDSSTWRKIDAPGPPARDEALLVYDAKRQRSILHGGRRRSVSVNDTWSWNGRQWQQLTEPGPSPRMGAAMVYDRHRDRVVLFGGSEGQTAFNDTWEFDGTAWAMRDTPSSPPGRSFHGMAYDELRGRVVIFGGLRFVNGRPASFEDTWEWNGSTWRRIDAPGIGARDHVSMVYAPDRRAVVLQGGARPDTGFQTDTWTYDGTAWRRLAESGPARVRHRLVYDGASHTVVSYGGFGPDDFQSNELWVLNGSAWEIR